MEKNIFKNAYFGKAYKTDKGDKAYYQKFAKTYLIEGIKECAAFPNVHILFTGNDIILADNNGIVQNLNSFNNIVSEYEEKIDEEQLDKLANNYRCESFTTPVTDGQNIDTYIIKSMDISEYIDLYEISFKDGFKAGFRAKKGE